MLAAGAAALATGTTSLGAAAGGASLVGAAGDAAAVGVAAAGDAPEPLEAAWQAASPKSTNPPSKTSA
jgi:hypothetical protein